MFRAVVIFLCLLAPIMTACQESTSDAAHESEALKAKLERQKSHGNAGTGNNLWTLSQELYKRRQYVPVWIVEGEPLPTVKALTTLLAAAQDEGLNPREYAVDEIPAKVQALKSGGSPTAASDLELYLTRTLLRYSSHVALGHPIARDIDKDWSVTARAVDIPGIILQALADQNLQELPTKLAPPHPEYGRLKSMLQRYRRIAAEGKLQQVPKNLKLKLGQPSPDLATLRNNLLILGDLQETPHSDENIFNEDLSQAKSEFKDRHAVPPDKDVDPKKVAVLDVYDDNMAEAVRRFESRHGLEPDGVPGAAVIAAMNVSPEVRVRQIELNLERWRWMPADFGSPYIFVNVADQRMQVRESNEAVPLKMRVIVGTKENRTPIFSDTMTEVVFSPYWNIPESIEAKEMLPSIMEDPEYLAHKDIEVIRIVNNRAEVIDPSSVDWQNPQATNEFQLRQRPGGENALGLVKFVFPNKHNVYFHDTPAGNLFDKLTRNFSHGCVRLEKPVDLAAYVLRDQSEWTPERIENAMHAEEEKHVHIKNPMAVHIVYLTARVDEDGEAQFFPDIYGYDVKQTERMSASAD